MFGKRLLFVASVAAHIRAFHKPFIEYLEKCGYQVEIACFPDVQLDIPNRIWPVPFTRAPMSTKNIVAYVRMRSLIKENKYDLIHVHTPAASFITRLAAKGTKIPVLYTAHGFHSYPGAPAKNRLVYGTIERLAAPWTAGMVVINREDLATARRMGFLEGENLFYVHGVGIDIASYQYENIEDDELSGLEQCEGKPIVLWRRRIYGQ